MFGLDPALGRDEPLRLLLLGAHADDVEIGAGGTVLRLLDERPQTEVTYVVFSGRADRAAETRAAAAALLAGAARADVHVLAYRDGYFPFEAADIKGFAQATLEGVRPHLVLTHRRDDAHQDHRVIADLAWQTFRGAAIAQYEIPKWDGDLDRPNAYVALDDDVMMRKLSILEQHFPSQQAKGWYDAETFQGLARIRGVEAGVRYAEAFHCAKLVW
ncbi:PIG-L deacetylase family protein [Rubrivirga marina]|uniref:PIG-L domain-containing protein n=1 Tax=Rubrivirga marina TaxID=1196024 RepID=A0A271J4U4_9BACT|nr:PIG-L family deacetylase [Rubrivirga marina]PAP77699.1 PIG-L domain-containing protein [Rubrivirga marina]